MQLIAQPKTKEGMMNGKLKRNLVRTTTIVGVVAGLSCIVMEVFNHSFWKSVHYVLEAAVGLGLLFVCVVLLWLVVVVIDSILTSGSFNPKDWPVQKVF